MRKSAVLVVPLAFVALFAPAGVPAVSAAADATPMAAAPRVAPAAGTPEPSPSDVPEGSERLFRVQDPRIRESSGLAVSRGHDGIHWTHNDSGDYGPRIYAVNGDGETVATVTLTGEGVEARDWEAIATGTDGDGDPVIYVGDIGDNFNGKWPNVRVYRIPEPDRLTDQTVTATTFTLTYEDRGRNAEAMMVDPRDGRLYVVSKEVAGGVYAAPKELDPDGTNTLRRVDSAPLYATDAAFSRDGAYYAIRTYWSAQVYDASEGVPGRSVGRVDLPKTEQGESLAFTRDGEALLAGSEGENSPVWRVPVAEEVGAGKSPEEDEERSPSPTADSQSSPAGGAPALIWTGVAVTVLLIGGIVVLVRKT